MNRGLWIAAEQFADLLDATEWANARAATITHAGGDVIDIRLACEQAITEVALPSSAVAREFHTSFVATVIYRPDATK